MADAIIDVARLREVLFYDPTSPSGLRWKVDRGYGAGGVKAGQTAGCLWEQTPGVKYWKVTTLRRQWYAHRVVWMIVHGSIQRSMQIDHIDGDSQNNQIGNLRLVSGAKNSRNQHRCTRNKTGVVGVLYSEKRNCYRAGFYDLNGKYISKAFGCARLGKDAAFAKAVAFRMEGISRLNELGAGYTEAHINKARKIPSQAI